MELLGEANYYLPKHCDHPELIDGVKRWSVDALDDVGYNAEGVSLSNRQIKAAERVGGIELVLPWQPCFNAPHDLEPDAIYETDGFLHALAEWLVCQSCDEHGLVPVRSRFRVLRQPPNLAASAGVVCVARLTVIIIGRRWVHATDAPSPALVWAEGA